MIKVNELKIGNYLTIGEELLTVEEILNEVKEQDLLPRFYCKSKEGIYYKSTAWNIEPIPITEEWLFNFGFHKEEDISKTKYYIKTNDTKCISILGKGEIIYPKIIIKNAEEHFTFCKIYIHELQNLYFTLTGEELTIKEL